ncbi:MAG: AbrB/MazE/SpoVT family DNA-binding domain-containing protein [Anaerolineae bacterium]|nr:AbrB/MazE/SpoVT family DNA-binding domain-containing protein [Anaerolineae bacterium]
MDIVLLQVRSNGQITLPASVRREANLEAGDTIEVSVEQDGSIRLIPKLIIDRSQAYFWSRQWQEGEQEAQADIENGRLHRFGTLEEAFQFLDADIT